MTRVYVDGIGVLGPGLANWPATAAVLRGAPYRPAPIVLPPVTQLPAAERRRTGAIVKLAIAVGLEALAERDAADMATVFTASGSDGETIHAILSVLATEQPEISPTRFHNSVHNAPSGYWALACGATAPSTSLCGFDGSFAIGLLDAAAQCVTDRRPVTLIAYDMPYPQPLAAARPISDSFATALVLATLDLALCPDDGAGTACADPALEALRRGNPAARALPLLAALAAPAGAGGFVHLEGIDGALLAVHVHAA